jgi:hypothetical protein
MQQRRRDCWHSCCGSSVRRNYRCRVSCRHRSCASKSPAPYKRWTAPHRFHVDHHQRLPNLARRGLGLILCASFSWVDGDCFRVDDNVKKPARVSYANAGA